MSDQPFDRAAILADIPAAISDGSLTISNCHKMGMTREQFVIASAKSPMATFDPSVGFNVDAILEDIPGAIDAGVLTQDNAHIIGLSRGGFVLIVADIQSGGGGGGGDFLPLAGGTMDAGAEIAFDNAARIRQTPNDYGLDLVCSIDYIHRWKEGSLYILDQSGGIRSVQYGLSFEPDANYDSSEGYIVGSRYIKDDGTTFECTDNTEGAAVWEEVGGGGGGGGNISDPGVAYITSDGSDAHGVIGNPHKPYATGTAAFNDGARSFDFGVGSFSITTDPSSNTSIFIRGKGYGNTSVYVAHIVDPGTPGEAGAPGLSGEEVWTPGSPGGNGGDGANAAQLRVDSDYSAYITVFAKGGDGGAGGAGGSGGVGPDFGTGPSYEVGGIGGNGGNGGNMAMVEVHNVTGTVSAGAGAGGAGGAGGTSGIGDALPGSSGSVGTCETAYVTMCRLFQDSGTETFPLQKIGSVFNGLFVAS